jgi:hypothetical protein
MVIALAGTGGFCLPPSAGKLELLNEKFSLVASPLLGLDVRLVGPGHR